MSNSFLDTEDKRILQDEPVEALGMIFHPIRMEHYSTFLPLREAIRTRQRALPVRYMFSDFITAVWELDRDRVQCGERPIGIFYSCILLTLLALQEEKTEKDFFAKRILYRFGENELKLSGFKFLQGEKETIVSPTEFSQVVRPLLAKQNGFTLPDECENLDIIEDGERRKALSNKSKPLKMNPMDLVSSVAYCSKVREKEIYRDWTVKEFENRRRAIGREKNFMLFSAAELSGMTTFKNGNPYPSWCFDTDNEDYGTIDLSSMPRDGLGKL